MAIKVKKPLDIKDKGSAGQVFALGVVERPEMQDFERFERGITTIEAMIQAMDLPPGVFIAGGFIRAAIDWHIFRMYRNGAAGDVDMYVSGNSPEESTVLLRKLILWLRPAANYVVSNYAVTLYVNVDRFTIDGSFLRSYKLGRDKYYKVQVILERVPATGCIEERIERIVSGYDLACCKVATDGKEIYMSSDAYVTIFVDFTCTVERRIVGPATANRIRKYALAGYNFHFADFTVNYNSEAMRYIRRAANYPVLGEVSNYDDSYNGNTLDIEQIYKLFCKHGRVPDVIAGHSDYVLESVDTLTADMTSFEAWEKIKLSELLEEDSRNISTANMLAMVEIHRNDLEAFKLAYSAVRLRPPFETPLARIVLAPEELERKWCQSV